MSTELKRFTDAYATMVVATYEPLILRWISLTGVRSLSSILAQRLTKAKDTKYDDKMLTVQALAQTIKNSLPKTIPYNGSDPGLQPALDINGPYYPY